MFFTHVFQIMKRNLNNVKRMTSHPIYQYCECLHWSLLEGVCMHLYFDHPSPRPHSNALCLSSPVCSLLSLLCVIFGVCAYVRRDRGTGRQCAHVWMEQTSAAHLLPTSRQRKSHPSLFQFPGQQGTHLCMCTYTESLCVFFFLSVQSDCTELRVFSPCSVELLTEKASSVSGRSTRHRPTLNPTWWGPLLHPLNHHPSTRMHIFKKHIPLFKSNMCCFFVVVVVVVLSPTELAVPH